jgi:hypothetical protein
MNFGDQGYNLSHNNSVEKDIPLSEVCMSLLPCHSDFDIFQRGLLTGLFICLPLSGKFSNDVICTKESTV